MSNGKIGKTTSVTMLRLTGSEITFLVRLLKPFEKSEPGKSLFGMEELIQLKSILHKAERELSRERKL